MYSILLDTNGKPSSKNDEAHTMIGPPTRIYSITSYAVNPNIYTMINQPNEEKENTWMKTENAYKVVHRTGD